MHSYRVAVVGAGYVGLTSSACLAHLGHDVVCVDVDEKRIERLKRGDVPLYEPGLADLVREGLARRRLAFGTTAADAVVDADVVMMCVPTPMCDDGRAELGSVESVVRQVRDRLPPRCVLVAKSTVPVGTCGRIRELLGRDDVHVASNPEFFREGHAVDDFLRPTRVVIGADDHVAAERLTALYAGVPAPRVRTDTVTAETTKYAANAFLAVKLSYVNVLAELCENVGADIRAVTASMGHDDRIGAAFLACGPGWGGSCLPKDSHELLRMARAARVEFGIVREALAANARQHARVVAQTRRVVTGSETGSLHGVRLALLGLTFKAGTDDLRDSPSLGVARLLAELGADLTGYDPCVPVDRSEQVAPVTVADDPYRAAKGACAVLLLTEWPLFRGLDWARMAALMERPVLLDTRDQLSACTLAEAGFRWHKLGGCGGGFQPDWRSAGTGPGR